MEVVSQYEFESLVDRFHELDERLSTLEQLTPAVELRGLLREAAERFRDVLKVDTHVRPIGSNSPPYCSWCKENAVPFGHGFDVSHHEDDCPYMAAREFLERLEAKLG